MPARCEKVPGRCGDRQAGTGTGGHTGTGIQAQAGTQAQAQAHRHTGRHTGTQAGRHTGTQEGRHRQADMSDILVSDSTHIGQGDISACSPRAGVWLCSPQLGGTDARASCDGRLGRSRMLRLVSSLPSQASFCWRREWRVGLECMGGWADGSGRHARACGWVTRASPGEALAPRVHRAPRKARRGSSPCCHRPPPRRLARQPPLHARVFTLGCGVGCCPQLRRAVARSSRPSAVLGVHVAYDPCYGWY